MEDNAADIYLFQQALVRAGLSHLAVAVMTSSEASRDYEKCVELGVSRYITKPLELEDFLQIGEIVKQVLLESMPGPK